MILAQVPKLADIREQISHCQHAVLMFCCSLRDHRSLECIFCPWGSLRLIGFILRWRANCLFLRLNDTATFKQPPWGLWIAWSPCWCHLGIKLCLGPIHWIKWLLYTEIQVSLECVVRDPCWNYLDIVGLLQLMYSPGLPCPFSLHIPLEMHVEICRGGERGVVACTWKKCTLGYTH